MVAENEELKRKRSEVRIKVTYGAAAFVFLGGAGLIAYALALEKIDFAKDIFFAVMPVGAAVISYWFAGRSAEKASGNQ